ncbi:MAG: PIN domain-containing protein [Caulobacter sp.]|nr:PIN domain-containing protein [Caulobacter sp.]
MSLSVDTCVVVDVLREIRPGARDRFLDLVAAGVELNLCVFAFHELAYGAMVSHRPVQQLSRLEELLRFVTVREWAKADAIAAAEIRVARRSKGRPAGVVDTLIAGQALARGWAVLTADVGDFEHIDGLTVIDWSS